MYTNEEIHALMPYSFAEVEGEPTLLERIMPAYETQQRRADSYYEQWTGNLKGRTDISTPTLTDAERLTEVRFNLDRWAAYSAISMTLPELDLVLTPNGFGVVNNQNLAPASKERVFELKEAVRQKVSDHWLLADHLWHLTEVFYRYHLDESAQWFTYYEVENIFRELQVADVDRMERRMNEHQLEESLLFLFGREVMNDLLHALYWNDDFTGGSNYSDTAASARRAMAVRVKGVLGQAFRADQSLFKDEQTDYIIRLVTADEELYDEWKQSVAYKNYKGSAYQNKRNSSAYVF